MSALALYAIASAVTCCAVLLPHRHATIADAIAAHMRAPVERELERRIAEDDVDEIVATNDNRRPA